MGIKLKGWFAACVVLGCSSGDLPVGIKATAIPRGNGPVVHWDPFQRPLPEIPFPNNIATYPDRNSPTGLRVNASMVGPTELESQVRRQIDRLDGFATYAPIWVSFDQPLDIENIRSRHLRDLHFGDDAFYLINIEPGSTDYGQAVPIDMGWGNFPIVLKKKNWFPNDYRADGSNLLFETVDEEKLGKDTNFDGEIMKSNLYDLNHDSVLNPIDDLVTFYEFETNSLIMQPLLPLRPREEYAVVLTRRLVGENGQPIQSPFEYVNHASQTKSLMRLVDGQLLDPLGLSIDDVSFTWTFTTQSTYHDLKSIREGMNGSGPFGWLEGAFPAEIKEVDRLKAGPGHSTIYQLDGDIFVKLLTDSPLKDVIAGSGRDATIAAVLDGVKHIDYFVVGSYDSPNFLENDEEIFMVDSAKGKGTIGTTNVTWFMCVPKQNPNLDPLTGQPIGAPFPLAIFAHGYTSQRWELFLYAGSLARMGIASIIVDAWGHGGNMDIPDPFDRDSLRAALESPLVLPPGVPGLGAVVDNLLFKGRGRDLDHDGDIDSGGDFWTADAFHTRDVVRQTAVDYFQLSRILRSWDGTHSWSIDVDHDGTPDLTGVAGDFNNDGIVDAGGPNGNYVMMGGSLGGIMAGVVPPFEPMIRSAISVSGAAGLIQVGYRSTQGGVNQAVLLRILGPLMIVRPNPQSGTPELAFHHSSVNAELTIPVAWLEEARPGDRIEAFNHKTGKTEFAIINDLFGARMGIQADTGDPLTVTLFDGDDRTAVKRVVTSFESFTTVEFSNPKRGLCKRSTDETTDGSACFFEGHDYRLGDRLVSMASGHGIQRQTPRFRRFMSVVAMALEPGDPVSYARHFFLEPLNIQPEGPATTNAIVMPTVGDSNVPVATGVANARAMGLLPITMEEAEDPAFRYGRSTVTAQVGAFDDWWSHRPSWGSWLLTNGMTDLSPNDVLLDQYVMEGDSTILRQSSRPIPSTLSLFDPDQYGDGAQTFRRDSINVQPTSFVEPLRITRKTDTGVSGMVLPFIRPEGNHGFELPGDANNQPFEMTLYLFNMMAHFVRSGGEELIADPCLVDFSCSFLPAPIPE